MAFPWVSGLLGWVLGIGLQLQQPELWSTVAYASLCAGGLVAAVLLWALGRPCSWAHGGGALGHWALALCIFGCAAALGAGQAGWRANQMAAKSLNPELQGMDLDLTGRIVGLPSRGAEHWRFEMSVEAAEKAGRPVDLPQRLQLSWYQRDTPPSSLAENGPRAGERWRLRVRLRSPHGNANPNGFDRERWLWENGIGATGYVRTGARDPAPQRLAQAPWRLARLRQDVSDQIRQRVSDPRSAGVLAALVVGEQSAIERADWMLFRDTGVAHLMSISGLHVTMFAWLAVRLVGAFWRRMAMWRAALVLAVPVPWAAGLGGVALATAYAAFSGWGIPSQRTVLMLALVVLLRLLGRQWPWPVVWLAAMALVLWLDPFALLQAGFWLSFVAVGILFASDPGQRQAVSASRPVHAGSKVRQAGGAGVRLLREQAVMTLALAPLSLLLFGQFSVVGLVANLLAIPWVTLGVTPLAMLGAVVPGLWELAALGVRGLTAVLAWLAQWPWAVVYRPVPPLLLALGAVVGGVLLVMPWPWAVRLAGLVLCGPALLWQPDRPAAGSFEVHAIDVGQGSALLVRTATHSMLYDTGPRYGPDSDAGQRLVVPLLRAWGEQPDMVVVSHIDSDHAGGMQAVRTAWPAARWLSSFDDQAARRCLAGQRWQWDGVDFEILHPSAEHYDPEGKGRLSSNAMSCVLRISNGQHAAWLGGDLDARHETRLALLRPAERATLLVAPHHGSQTSSSPVLLNTLQPRWVLVQSGYRNRFQHPSEVVLERYRARGIRWAESPVCGMAVWRSEEPDQVACHREQVLRFWHHGAAMARWGRADPAGAPEHLPGASWQDERQTE